MGQGLTRVNVDPLIETLPLPQRLALSYAPGAAKPATLAVFALDARLGQAVRQASEPIMGQMRLAWWRDQLGLAPAARERSDELVRALDALAGREPELIELVDGWEELLAEQLDVRAYAQGRAAGFGALATRDSAERARQAGRVFALGDLAANLGPADERRLVTEEAANEPARRGSLPRALRSLTVLEALARRSLARGGTPLLDGPGAMLTALRLGIVGR
jgi:phytoene synthase